MPAIDIGIDLGTRNSLVYSTAKGMVLQEPSVAVYDKAAQRIRAIGEEARLWSGHLAAGQELIWPIRQGVIADYIVLEKMLKFFISRAMGRHAFLKPRIGICVPSTITQIGKKALEEAAYQAGARKVYLVDQSIASAIGAGLDVKRPFGNLVVDIGAGSTDVAVISMVGVVVSHTIKVAGDAFDKAITAYLRKTHSLFIGEEAAENIKRRIGAAVESQGGRVMDVKGRNVSTGLPKVVALSGEEVRQALQTATGQIVDGVHSVLEKTPPELAADIVDRGIVLTGGGSLLRGMDTLLEQRTGISAMTVQDALQVAAIGTAKYAEIIS